MPSSSPPASPSSSPPASPVRILDLARPRLPWWLEALNVLAAPIAARIRFDADALLEASRRRTGLEDFGPASFEEPFRLYIDCIQDTPFSAFGRISQRAMIGGLLDTRLRIEAVIAAHPEILEQPIAQPIVIAGLPRTGTTHLFNLIAQHPGLRSLPYWESLEPIPGPKDRPQARESGDPDPRIARCERTLGFMNRVMPLFPAMHEFEPEVPHEEVQLQMMQFATCLIESMLDLPRYADWYHDTDQTPHYAYLKRVLQVCQFLDPGADPERTHATRWILKSPQHIAEMPALFATFPDVRVIRTHRDPARIVASLATMISYGRRMTLRKDAIDPHAIGRHWANRIETWLHETIEHEKILDRSRILDVRFHEFMKDDVGTALRVLDWADQPVSGEAADAIHALATRNVRGKHGTIAYPLEDLGLEASDLRERFRFYQERFDLPDDL